MSSTNFTCPILEYLDPYETIGVFPKNKRVYFAIEPLNL